jgi:hypothetical protein
MPRAASTTVWMLVGLLATSCGDPPAPAAVATPAPAPTRAPDDAPDVTGVEAPPWPLPEHVLHPWETALIVIDPHHLTAQQRLQRAYARRKMIMLNPDSATARVLDDLAKAAAAGEIDPNAKGGGMVFTAPGVAPNGPPPGAAPPAGTRVPGANP